MNNLRTKYTVRVFFNETHGHRFFQYHEGDELKPSELNTHFALEHEGQSHHDLALDACDQVFGLMNADNRPNGKTERSLSVGDVIALEDEEGKLYVYAVESVGFKKLENWRM